MSNLFIENNSLKYKVEKLLATPTSLGQSAKKKAEEPDMDAVDLQEDMGTDADADADADADSDSDSEYSDKLSSSSSDKSSSLSDDLSFFDEDRDIHYLGNNSDILQYDFDLCKDNFDVTKKYQVQICGYKVNEKGFHPFLEYFMTLTNGTLLFPSFTFNCYNNIQVEDDEEYSPEHVYFKYECMKQVATILDIYDHSEHSTAAIMAMYKGFLRKEVEPTVTGPVNVQNILYVFFDFTGFSQMPPLDKTQKHLWITLDEIVNVQHAFAYTIDPNIVSLFKENNELCELRDQKNRILDFPRVMYLCENAGSSYKNDFHMEEKEEDVEFSILDNRTDHPILGNFYLFSVKPFPTQQSIFLIRRFAGFYVKPLYIVKNLTKAIEMSHFVPMVSGSAEVPMTLGMVIPTLVDYVSKKPETKDEKEPDQEEEQMETTPELADPFEEENKKAMANYQEKTLVEEKEILEDAEVVQMELNELPDLDNSCTYFHETVNGINTAFWMMKSSLHFTEL